jgi:hypothetical protein
MSTRRFVLPRWDTPRGKAHLLVLVILCLPWVSSCGRPKEVRNAEEKLRELLNFVSNDTTWPKNNAYVAGRITEVLHRLHSDTSVARKAIPVYVTVVGPRENLRLNMCYLDGGWRARGIVLENTTGYFERFMLLDWRPQEKRVCKGTILRRVLLPVRVQGEPTRERDMRFYFGEVVVPKGLLETDMRFRLALEDGTVSESIPIQLRADAFAGEPASAPANEAQH